MRLVTDNDLVCHRLLRHRRFALLYKLGLRPELASMTVYDLIGEIVHWSCKIGPVTVIMFRSGRSLHLHDPGLFVVEKPYAPT